MFRIRTMPSLAVILCMSALLLSTAGCSPGPDLPPMAKTSGRVTLDGKPLPCGTVVFIPDVDKGLTGPTGVGQIDKDGYYQITTASADGALVGWHKVRVVALDETKPGKPWLIPFEYDRPDKSGLTAEVKAAERNVINLPLKSDL